MKRQERSELERLAQSVERQHPDWPARQVESALAESAPVAYGDWREETPNLRSRLRAVQRWRIGARGRGAGRGIAHLFPYVWPVGDRQRQELDTTWNASHVATNGSWRLYLYNCAPEVVRDVRVYLDGSEIDYAPSILMGKFAEIHWQRVESVRAQTLDTGTFRTKRYRFEAEFVIARGTRQARIEGELSLDSQQGWTFFASLDGRRREIE